MDNSQLDSKFQTTKTASVSKEINWRAGHSLQQIVSEWARECPDRVPLIFLSQDGEEERISYARLDADARRVAGALQEAGINPGDLVIVVLPHSYKIVAAYIGAMYYGAVPTIFDDRDAKPEEYQDQLQALLQASGARAILTSTDTLQALSSVEGPARCELVVFPDLASQVDASSIWSDLSACSEDDPAHIIYSSGATGMPKGIVISHRALINAFISYCAHQQISSSDTYIGWLPLHHGLGMGWQVLAPLLYGGPSYIMHSAHWLRRPISLFQAVHRYKGTIVWMPNFAFRYCTQKLRAEDLHGLDLSSLRVFGNASEPVSLEALHEFAAHFAPYGLSLEALKIAYGMSEITSACTMTLPNSKADFDWISHKNLHTERVAVSINSKDADAMAIPSCGYPMPGVELYIVDDQGVVLPERTIGEVLVKSNSLFTGYYRQPELTEMVVQNGWLHTGDLGYLAGEQLFLYGRKKDLIIVGGRKISPQVVEESAAAVIGLDAGRVVAFAVKDALLGTEQPVLVCEVSGLDDVVQRETLIKKIRRQVLQDTRMALGDVRLVEPGWVALTNSGKIARPANHQKYLDTYVAPQASAPKQSEVKMDGPVQSLTQQITQIFQEILGVRDIRPEDDFFALGGDSLSALRLTLRVEEQIGREVPAEFFKDATVMRLVSLLEGSHLGEQKGARIPDANWFLKGKRRQVKGGMLARIKRAGRSIWQSNVFFQLRVRILAWLCGQAWYQNRFYSQQVRLVKEFYAVLNNPRPSLQRVIQGSLVANIGRAWKHPVVSTPGKKSLDKWVQVRGEEHYQKAMQDGKGIVLATNHSSGTHILRGYIQANAQNKAYLVRNAGKSISGDLPGRDVRSSYHSSQMVGAYHVLRQGGMVVIAGDGVGGKRAVFEIPFHGRKRKFMGGLSELVQVTGAAVVPVFVSNDLHWCATIQFFPPIQQLAQIDGVEARDGSSQEALTMAYVKLLEEYWSDHPASLPWRVMKQHLSRQLPPGDAQ